MIAGGERPIGEDDLHGFVDGRLDAARHAAVRRYLSERPAEAKRVGAFTAQRDALRAALAFKAAEPVPARLRLGAIRAARRRAGFARLREAAMVAGLILAGAGLGWLARDAFEDRDGRDRFAITTEAAIEAATEARPAPAAAPKPALHAAVALLGWVHDGAGEPMPMPDLTGFGFVLEAAQPLASEDGGAVLLRYAGKAAAALFVARQRSPDGQPHPLRCADGPAGLVTYTWSDGRHLHAVTAVLPRDTLRPIAHAVERAIRDAPPPPEGLMAAAPRRACPTGLG